MLLDRRKIRRWARWVALGLVIVFAVAFLFVGVGSGPTGSNISEIFSGGCTESSPSDTSETNAELQTMLDALTANPQDTAAMLKLAAYYEGLYSASSGSSTESAKSAVEYYKMALETDPTLKAVYLELAKLYINMSSFAEAAKVLNDATAVDPINPDIYFYLGKAQRSAGNTGEAILAWQKYLELAPDGKLAATVRTELQKMTAPSTTTTVAAATTTTTK